MKKLLHHTELFRCLVLRDLTVRYKRSALGILWAFAEPLVLMVLFTIVFSVFIGIQTPTYPVFVLCGIVVWNFCHTGVIYSLSSVSANANLVKKIYFPREILPLALVTGRLTHFLLSLGLLLPFLFWYQIMPAWQWLWVLVLVGLAAIFVAGLALLFCAFATLYEDAAFLVNFGFSGLFYLSPVFYPIDVVPEPVRDLYLLNPIAFLITAFRGALLFQSSPSFFHLAITAVLACLVFGLGYLVFKRMEPVFAEVL